MLRFVVVLVLIVMCQGSEVPESEDLKQAAQLLNKLSTTGELGDLLCSCKKPADCYDMMKLGGGQTSGFYDIYPTFTGIPMKVRCDMESDGGGWTVIQRRVDGSVDFDRGWEDYKFGFGILGGEFWLGNENIHDITNQKEYELCVETTSYDNSVNVNYYNHFRVAEESRSYRLLTGTYTGREETCSIPLGIESGAITDKQLTASSENAPAYGPSKGRLGQDTTTWIAKTQDVNQWIQVNFGVPKLVTGVITQGRHNTGHWVKTYKILYGNDGKNWKVVQNADQDDDMIFDGNTDQHTKVTNYFADVPVKAQYIRIQIATWVGSIALRMELLGCDGDFLAYQTNQPFSTKDSGNDNDGEASCAAGRGAWWYGAPGACEESSLNGRYRVGAAIVNKGIRWIDFQGEQWSLKSTEMKIRPVSHHACDVDE